MRFAMMVAAAVAAVAAMPASAKVFYVGFSAYVTGYQSIITCPPGQTMNCPIVDSPFSKAIAGTVGPLDLAEGANSFSYGYVYLPSGYVTGTIVRTGDFLTGVNLSYGRSICGAGNTNNGCGSEAGVAPTFAVSGGVPEPASWALMVTGFGAVGFAMRRRQTINRWSSRSA